MTVGEVHWIELPPGTGHEQSGRRPAVIVQDQAFAGLLPSRAWRWRQRLRPASASAPAGRNTTPGSPGNAGVSPTSPAIGSSGAPRINRSGREDSMSSAKSTPTRSRRSSKGSPRTTCSSPSKLSTATGTQACQPSPSRPRSDRPRRIASDAGGLRDGIGLGWPLLGESESIAGCSDRLR